MCYQTKGFACYLRLRRGPASIISLPTPDLPLECNSTDGLEPHQVRRSVRSNMAVALLRVVGLSFVVRTEASCCAPLGRFKAFNCARSHTTRSHTLFVLWQDTKKQSRGVQGRGTKLFRVFEFTRVQTLQETLRGRLVLHILTQWVLKRDLLRYTNLFVGGVWRSHSWKGSVSLNVSCRCLRAPEVCAIFAQVAWRAMSWGEGGSIFLPFGSVQV